MKKILVANRGEIAVRVIRSAKEMGIQTIAVYSEADRDGPPVRLADEAVCIGPPPSNQSYLLGDKIIEIALERGADGIHPGFGFLSENAEFAKKVTDAGITFIGPSPHSINIMGSKLAAKAAVANYNIPMVPGTDKALEDIAEGKQIAKEIGFPILVKASAGGGGKGMRIVENEEEFETQLKMAISEAESSFGDGAVFIEKYISSPRHIEIQILGDQHGNIVHLFERECSIQRRHQKVVEEAPSSVLSEELRHKMGQSAIDVARSCEYFGAGTVEFLLDENHNYYFLEMNTRLQVEHPVTEMITGIDLVKEQIKVARGEKLSFTQDDLSINGHAMELRVYAEDPTNNFLPDIGNLAVYDMPQGPGVRVDSGYVEGMDIPIYYDPMLSKLITHGKDRTESIDRMKRAISEFRISGVKTTLAFGDYVMNHPAFVSGDFDTHFVKIHFDPNVLVEAEKDQAEIAAQFAAWFVEESKGKQSLSSNGANGVSQWKIRRRIF